MKPIRFQTIALQAVVHNVQVHKSIAVRDYRLNQLAVKNRTGDTDCLLLIMAQFAS